MDCTVQGSNPGGGEIFRTNPEWPQVPPILLYNGYWVSFPGVKLLGHDPSSPEVKERLELYCYSP